MQGGLTPALLFAIWDTDTMRKWLVAEVRLYALLLNYGTKRLHIRNAVEAATSAEDEAIAKWTATHGNK